MVQTPLLSTTPAGVTSIRTATLQGRGPGLTVLRGCELFVSYWDHVTRGGTGQDEAALKSFSS